jgi:hypothetical protein
MTPMHKRNLQAWFLLVFIVLLAGTIYASLEKNVLQAYVDLGRDRWGLATLFDAYFAFTAVWLWVAYKEAQPWKQALWFVLIMGLGNFAISGYALWQLAQWDPKTGATGLLLRAPAKAPARKKRR